ncbi:MAG: DUF2231 domain-containing protein [Anaerolineae bacterium]|nr:DUF2231 domain-containing protein [Anaerolineae bacterium]
MTENTHEEHKSGITSTVNIAGHPVHPMLVPFPITFLVSALLTDIAYWGSLEDFWARASLWLIAAGLASGLLAGLVGAIDYFTIERARGHRAGRLHAAGNVTAVVLAAINLAIRWGDPAAPILWWGLILSLVTALILGVTGWYGGELTFRHKIGVTGHK